MAPTAALDDDSSARRSRLLAVKLSALVRDHDASVRDPIEPGALPGGAALRRGGEAWVLADRRPERFLGPALAWSLQGGSSTLHLLCEGAAAGVLARRAALFARPPEVWAVEGRVLVSAEPVPVESPAAPDAALVALVPLIEAAGAEPVIEHGVLAGEVRGLEVCRAVRDAFTGAVRLEVGVGVHDREAFTLMHGEIPTEESLRRVVAAVAHHRADGADPHPLNRLAAERLVRSRVVDDPHLVGATILAPASPPVARDNLKDPVPAVATGHRADGRPVVVVCSVGIDLDLVPFAADARAAANGGGEADLLLVVPERDAHSVTRRLAAMLAEPATVVSLPR